jgi:hypothetical protein
MDSTSGDSMTNANLSRLPREAAIAAFGSIWLAEDFNGRICEHLGRTKPSLHYGAVYPTLEEAVASRPPHYQVVRLGETIAMPTVTPVPGKRLEGSRARIPHEVYLFEFDDLLEKGLRVSEAIVDQVAFDIPHGNILAQVDFVATCVTVGGERAIKVDIGYDNDLSAVITENPSFPTPRGYQQSGQCMAFFDERQAKAAADDFAAKLTNAANWRGRAAA